MRPNRGKDGSFPIKFAFAIALGARALAFAFDLAFAIVLALALVTLAAPLALALVALAAPLALVLLLAFAICLFLGTPNDFRHLIIRGLRHGYTFENGIRARS